jgi:hypothetical protein
MDITTVQLEQQRSVIRSIVDGIGTIEDVVHSEVLTQGGRQTIGGMLAQLRRNALETINNQEITEKIVAGYKETALDNLDGIIRLITQTITEGTNEITDEQLLIFAMAARNFSDKAYYYLDLKAGGEVNHG